jgi:outer membrane protein TolC
MFIHFPLYRATVAVLTVACVLPSWAADPLTLAEAQRIAAGRSQQLLAQDALTTAAREQAVAAAQLPDPVLKLGIDNLPVNGEDRFSLTNDFMTQRRIGLTQEIPGAEKRQLRAERFEQDARRAQAQRQVTLANVQRDTALAWLDRYYIQAQRELVSQQLEEARLQVQAADVAFRTGRGSQADAFAARAAMLALQDRLQQVDQQLRNATLALARWVGTTEAQRPVSGQPPWESPPAESTIAIAHLEQHPDLQALAAEIDAAQTGARLAQANKTPDWSVEASYSHRGPAYSNMVSLGVSIPLQWDQQNRQDRELAAKLAQVAEAQARYEDLLRSHEAEVRGWLNDWQTGRERLNRYRNELIPTARQRSEAALTAYRSGKSDLTTVLVARRDEIDARMQALSLEIETARSWAKLNFLVPQIAMISNARKQP